MGEVIEFELEHDLDYDEAVECVYDMLDEYYDNDDFDELEWDEDDETAYLANEAMEIEIYVEDDVIEVWAEIYDRDMDPDRVERDLRNDLMEFFDIEERPRRARRSAPPRRKSSGRARRSEPEENRGGRSRSDRKKKRGGSSGNWDMDEPAPKREAKEDKPVVKQEAEKPEKSGGSSMWIWIVLILIIGGIAAAVFMK